MTFDTPTRGRLQRLVDQARDLLIGELTAQCQGTYGIQPDGSTLPLARLAHLPVEEQTRAGLLRERIDHLAAAATGKQPRAGAVDRLIREQAFTVLNRLCALRLCEERGLVQECVRAGDQSKGFRLFEQASRGLGGDTHARYRLFLELLFDELALDLGVLFDRFALSGLLFPREQALGRLLDLINAPHLTPVWRQDETIGWVYQYFNSPEERAAMRKGSSAPRNSRELAVRNQFFTPRYVVEFLTDNSLGRLWYEMRRGDTGLTDHCRLLLRRPGETFLGPGEPLPERAAGDSDTPAPASPEPVPHRPKKDPRDLRILDPACGSGHFLLYAFDLLLTIYREAMDDPDSPPSAATGTRLRDDYDSAEALAAAVPELILRHNLHGVDIDPRAVQIAALALWLRAQRAWQEQGLKPDRRPPIRRTNLVCAEPMPGGREHLKTLTDGLRPAVLGQLVQVVFQQMQLAGEAGTLLRIEQAIQDAVEQARRQWAGGTRPEQHELFPDLAAPRQQQMQFDVAGITNAAFWDRAEALILQRVADIATEAAAGEGAAARLFADDTARGFAFIDLCRRRFDVVLMNPPFGAAAAGAKARIAKDYPRSKNDLLAAFVERGIELLHPGGLLGAITSRTAFFLTSYRQWRQGVVLGEARPLVMADLGYGVMDAAMVEAAAYVLRKQ